MADIKVKIPNDMEADVYAAFMEAYPPEDPNTEPEQNCIDHIDDYVTRTYLAYMDKQAENTVKDDATADLETEKDKNKDKASDIITTK